MYKNINVSIAKHLPKSNCMSTEVDIFGSLVISSDSTDPGEKKKCYMNKIRCIDLEFYFDMYKNIKHQCFNCKASSKVQLHVDGGRYFWKFSNFFRLYGPRGKEKVLYEQNPMYSS